MSLTVDRLLDERPEVVFLKRVVEGEIDDFEYEMDCTFPVLEPEGSQPGNAFGVIATEYEGKVTPSNVKLVRIVFSCQPWAGAVVREDDEGRLEIEILYDTEGDGEGQRDLVMVRGFTPGYNDPA